PTTRGRGARRVQAQGSFTPEGETAYVPCPVVVRPPRRLHPRRAAAARHLDPMSVMRRGSIRGQARDASAAAENLPALLSSLRAALSRIPLAWLSIAALLTLAVLGGERLHAGLAKLGLGPLVLWAVLGGSAVMVLASQV